LPLPRRAGIVTKLHLDYHREHEKRLDKHERRLDNLEGGGHETLASAFAGSPP